MQRQIQMQDYRYSPNRQPQPMQHSYSPQQQRPQTYQPYDRYNGSSYKSTLHTSLVPQQQEEVITPNENRSCTDLICAILMTLVIIFFITVLIYALIVGDAAKIVAVFNSDEVRCNTNQQFPFGFFTTIGTLSNAVCVSQCPQTANIVTQCLPDTVNCIGGTFTPTYATGAIDTYCIPLVIGDQINLENLFNFDAFEQWAYDLKEGWAVLVTSLFGAIVLSLVFLVLVRWCAVPIIWISIILAIACTLTIGIFFILEAKGVTIPAFVSSNLSTFNFDSLLTVGIYLIVSAVLLTLLVICLRSRISMGANCVKLGSLFIAENCTIVILPISQGFIIIMALLGLIAGAASLYSQGVFSFPNNAAIASVSLTAGQVVLAFFYIGASVWIIFFLNGCNQFILCSTVSIWYFKNSLSSSGSPCCDSLWRTIRFHPGSIAFASLFNGLLFILKLLANLLSFDSQDDDSALVSCCLKCLNCIFCIFKIFLRFLNDGTYVQMAIHAEGYCQSASKAYEVLSDNALKLTVTSTIAILFTIMGVLAVSFLTALCAYFATLYLPYYQQRIQSPIIVAFISGIIAFIISVIYLSMIDVTSISVLTCYLTDSSNGQKRAINADQRIVEILHDQ